MTQRKTTLSKENGTQKNDVKTRKENDAQTLTNSQTTARI
jgi:hypothetical protein